MALGNPISSRNRISVRMTEVSRWSIYCHQAVTRAAERSPEQEAVRCSGQSLSYAELEQRVQQPGAAADRARRAARRSGGIYMNKSLESAVAVYGIMKAGAAYVPLDPFAPVARIGYVIRDCGIRCLVTGEEKRGQVWRDRARRSQTWSA